MRLLPALCLALLAAAQSSFAAAQHPLVLDRLREINAQAPPPSTGAQMMAILSTAQAFGEANGTCVPEAITLEDVAPLTGARAVLQAVLAGEIRNGWSVYATYRSCPETDVFRYMVLQKADGSLIAPLVNEGRTFANPSIMRDTSALAALVALRKATSVDSTCTGGGMKMGPTRVTAQSKNLGPDVFGVRYVGSWSEIWRFETCGRAFDVPVEFTADGDGGAYTNIKGDAVAIVP